MLDHALRQDAFADDEAAAQAKPTKLRTAAPPCWPRPETGIHPIAVETALGAALWFLAVTWIGFARGGEVDLDLVVVTFFFVFFFGLLLLTASYAVRDPRWHLRDASFRDFLESPVGTATGTMRGRDALIEILVMPIALALAATAVALVWIALH